MDALVLVGGLSRRKGTGHLEPADIRAWYHRLAKDHQATADDCYRILRAVVNTAVADGHLAKNPCTVKGAGSVRADERPGASVVEVARVADEMPDRLRAAVLLAAWCQMRVASCWRSRGATWTFSTAPSVSIKPGWSHPGSPGHWTAQDGSKPKDSSGPAEHPVGR